MAGSIFIHPPTAMSVTLQYIYRIIMHDQNQMGMKLYMPNILELNNKRLPLKLIWYFDLTDSWIKDARVTTGQVFTPEFDSFLPTTGNRSTPITVTVRHVRYYESLHLFQRKNTPIWTVTSKLILSFLAIVFFRLWEIWSPLRWRSGWTTPTVFR